MNCNFALKIDRWIKVQEKETSPGTNLGLKSFLHIQYNSYFHK